MQVYPPALRNHTEYQHSEFLNEPDLVTEGKIDGDLQISLRDGIFDCQGGMSLVDFSLQGGPLKDSLSSNEASIKCRNGQLFSPISQWKYGPLITSINGQIPLNNKPKFELSVNSSIRLRDVSSSDLNVIAKLPFQFTRSGLKVGELLADLNLRPFIAFITCC